MPILKRDSEKRDPGQQVQPDSSPGTQPVSETPKDLAPEDAASHDLMERCLASDDLEQLAQAMLDEAVEETFPASDPIAVPTFEEMLAVLKARQEARGAAPKQD